MRAVASKAMCSSRRVVRALPLVAAGVGGVVLHEATPGLLRRLAAEDGVLETAQALCYLLAALSCGWGLVRRTATRWAVPVGLGSLLLLGEEISWGQRLFGFTGPESVTGHNRQGEFNVHNLPGVHENIRDVGVVLLLLVFIAVPLLARRRPALSWRVQRLGLVVPGALCTTTAALAIAYMRIPRWLGLNYFGFDEYGETFLAVTVVAYAWQLAQVRRGTCPRSEATVPMTPPRARHQLLR